MQTVPIPITAHHSPSNDAVIDELVHTRDLLNPPSDDGELAGVFSDASDDVMQEMLQTQTILHPPSTLSIPAARSSDEEDSDAVASSVPTQLPRNKPSKIPRPIATLHAEKPRTEHELTRVPTPIPSELTHERLNMLPASPLQNSHPLQVVAEHELTRVPTPIPSELAHERLHLLPASPLQKDPPSQVLEVSEEDEQLGATVSALLDDVTTDSARELRARAAGKSSRVEIVHGSPTKKREESKARSKSASPSRSARKTPPADKRTADVTRSTGTKVSRSKRPDSTSENDDTFVTFDESDEPSKKNKRKRGATGSPNVVAAADVRRQTAPVTSPVTKQMKASNRSDVITDSSVDDMTSAVDTPRRSPRVRTKRVCKMCEGSPQVRADDRTKVDNKQHGRPTSVTPKAKKEKEKESLKSERKGVRDGEGEERAALASNTQELQKKTSPKPKPKPTKEAKTK